MTKSEAAFQFSVETLAEQSEQNQIYFWTLTFVKCLNDDEAREQLYKCIRAFSRWWPKIKGLRVVEVHPGGHGLHYHLLVDTYMDADMVRACLSPYGIGRVNVQRVKSARAVGKYLSKYLSKRNAANASLKRGTRRWAKFGKWEHSKVKNIEVDNSLTRNLKKIGKAGIKITFAAFLMLSSMTKAQGEFSDAFASSITVTESGVYHRIGLRTHNGRVSPPETVVQQGEMQL